MKKVIINEEDISRIQVNLSSSNSLELTVEMFLNTKSDIKNKMLELRDMKKLKITIEENI